MPLSKKADTLRMNNNNALDFFLLESQEILLFSHIAEFGMPSMEFGMPNFTRLSVDFLRTLHVRL